MTDEIQLIEQAFAQSLSEHYKQASDELLHAYQCNKQAAQHHAAGALKAALHHAKLCRHHTFNAHEHLKDVLHEAEKTQPTSQRSSAPGRGHVDSALQ